MRKLRALIESSFRMKVLVPVLVVMVFLLTITAWVVGRRIMHQFDTEAARALNASNEGFREWQRNRAKNLLVRFGDLRNEPRYKAAFQTGDAPTIRVQLGYLLKGAEQDVKTVLFTTSKEKLIASASQDPLVPVADFAAGCSAVVQQSLHGQERVDTFRVGEKLYTVVSIPAFDPNGDICGALTFCLELGKEVAAELSRFTRSDVVLLVKGRAMVQTILVSDSSARFASLFEELSRGSDGANTTFGVRKEVFDDWHYYCSGGRFSSLDGTGTLGYLLLYSYEDSWRTLMATQRILLAVNGVACLLGSLVVCYVVGKVTRPLRELRDSVEAVGHGDFSRRVQVRHPDECGELARVFNQMTENLTRSREELESAHAALIESSRRAGMAEAATGVLHNVGNVLTSVNIASGLMAESLKKSRAANLAKVVALLHAHEADLGDFIARDPQGKRIPEYLSNLSEHLIREQEGTIQELAELQKGLMHIKDIVHAQQSYSKVSGKPETLGVADLVEDALKMNSGVRSSVRLVKEVDPALKVTVEKHKALQILVNLLSNARQACEESTAEVKTLTVRATSGKDLVRIAVSDNGVGIAPENLDRIFCHGFTTKKEGHGFGLHNSAQTAKELGGALVVNSDGPGKGATFTLELPVEAKNTAV